MGAGGGWDDAVTTNREKGFFNHSANAVSKTGPVYFYWEVKEGISAEEFQDLSIALLAQVLTKMHL